MSESPEKMYDNNSVFAPHYLFTRLQIITDMICLISIPLSQLHFLFFFWAVGWSLEVSGGDMVQEGVNMSEGEGIVQGLQWSYGWCTVLANYEYQK